MGRLRLYMDDRGRLAMNGAGFSWLAAFSLPLWALQRRLYVLALAAHALIAVSQAVGGVWGHIAFLLQAAASGAFANRLHRWHLERAGWRVTAEEPSAVAQSPAEPRG